MLGQQPAHSIGLPTPTAITRVRPTIGAQNSNSSSCLQVYEIAGKFIQGSISNNFELVDLKTAIMTVVNNIDTFDFPQGGYTEIIGLEITLDMESKVPLCR